MPPILLILKKGVPYRILLLFLLSLSISCEKDEAKSIGYATENVIVVVIDGPRYSETWGEPSFSFIPKQSGELAPQGVMYTEFSNNGPTYTNAGHVAITTGMYQKIDNRGNELPMAPSIFQYWSKTHGAKQNDVWVIASKDKLEILADCQDINWQGSFNPNTDCGNAGLGSGYRQDTETFAQALEILARDHPKLTLINFREPDTSGHANNWDSYLQGIRDTDAYIFQLWEFIQDDPIYRNKTALLVTNDHGRHLDGVADGFVSHGDTCAGCTHISLFAIGPDFKKGVVIPTPGELIDIPVTIAEILNFNLPDTQGEILEGLFE